MKFATNSFSEKGTMAQAMLVHKQKCTSRGWKIVELAKQANGNSQAQSTVQPNENSQADKKAGILDQLVPMMPIEARSFWTELPTSVESPDLAKPDK